MPSPLASRSCGRHSRPKAVGPASSTIIGPVGRRMPASVGVVAHRDEHGDIEYYSALSRDLTDQRSMTAARRRSETHVARDRAVVAARDLCPRLVAARSKFGTARARSCSAGPPTRSSGAARVRRRRRRGDGRARGARLRRRNRQGASGAVRCVATADRRRRRRARAAAQQQDEVVAAIAVLADVTEQKRVELALLVESEVWFRSLVQNSSDMVMVIGPDGTFDYMSPSAAEFVGFRRRRSRRSAVSTRSCLPIPTISRSLQETFRALARRAGLGRDDDVPAAARRRRDALDRDGGQQPASTTPAVRGIVINARDITETVRSRRSASARPRNGCRRLVSSVSDAISVVGADGSLLYSSPVADAMFGDPAGECAGDGLRRTRPGRSRPLPSNSSDRRSRRPGRVPARGSALPPRRRLDRSTPRSSRTTCSTSPSVHGIVMTIRDITERKRAERGAARERRGACARARRATGRSSTTRPSSCAAICPTRRSRS